MSKFVKDMGSSNHSAEYILPEIIDHIARLRRTILHSSSGPSTIAIGGAIELRPVDLTVERVASVFELLVPARVDAATYEFKFYVKSLEVPAFLSTFTSLSCSITTDTAKIPYYPTSTARATITRYRQGPASTS